MAATSNTPASFSPTEDFWSDETQSQYVVGLVYTVRTPVLAKIVEQWVQAGKAMIIDGAVSRMSGKGE